VSRENVTLADIRRSATSPRAKLVVDQLLWSIEPPPYHQWADAVEKAIALVGAKMSQKRNHLNGSSEDALTTSLLLILDGLGFEAEMAVVNGNCDVVVKLNNYLWLGEAKIATSASWIWKGYLQLTTRYATGQIDQDRGGMILYCSTEPVPEAMSAWRAALCHELNLADTDLVNWPHSDKSFISKSIVAATGNEISVLHQAIPLYHNPQDALIKLSPGASQAARLAKSAVKNQSSD